MSRPFFCQNPRDVFRLHLTSPITVYHLTLSHHSTPLLFHLKNKFQQIPTPITHSQLQKSYSPKLFQIITQFNPNLKNPPKITKNYPSPITIFDLSPTTRPPSIFSIFSQFFRPHAPLYPLIFTYF